MVSVRSVRNVISVLLCAMMMTQSAYSAEAVYSVSVSSEMGAIKERFKATTPGETTVQRTLIHIQDAHMSYEAQKNLAGIIQSITAQWNVPTVFVEGAAGKLDLERFRLFPFPGIHRVVATQYLRKGIFTGAEYAAITASHAFSVVGVEDEPLFVKHFSLLSELRQREPAALKEVALLEEAAVSYRTRVCSPQLADFLLTVDRYESGSMTVESFVAFLLEIATTYHVDVTDYPYFIHVQEWAQGGMPGTLPEVGDPLVRSLPQLSDTVAYSIARTERERQCIRDRRMLSLVHSLVTRQIPKTMVIPSREEIKRGLACLEEVLVIEGQNHCAGITRRMMPIIERATAFYTEADKRSRALVQNAVQAMQQQNQQIGILITGGYHSADITAWLKEQNVNYVVIAPRVKSPEPFRGYEARMAGSLFQLSPELVSTLDGQGTYLAAHPLDIWRNMTREEIIAALKEIVFYSVHAGGDGKGNEYAEKLREKLRSFLNNDTHAYVVSDKVVNQTLDMVLTNIRTEYAVFAHAVRSSVGTFIAKTLYANIRKAEDERASALFVKVRAILEGAFVSLSKIRAQEREHDDETALRVLAYLDAEKELEHDLPFSVDGVLSAESAFYREQGGIMKYQELFGKRYVFSTMPEFIGMMISKTVYKELTVICDAIDDEKDCDVLIVMRDNLNDVIQELKGQITVFEACHDDHVAALHEELRTYENAHDKLTQKINAASKPVGRTQSESNEHEGPYTAQETIAHMMVERDPSRIALLGKALYDMYSEGQYIPGTDFFYERLKALIAEHKGEDAWKKRLGSVYALYAIRSRVPAQYRAWYSEKKTELFRAQQRIDRAQQYLDLTDSEVQYGTLNIIRAVLAATQDEESKALLLSNGIVSSGSVERLRKGTFSYSAHLDDAAACRNIIEEARKFHKVGALSHEVATLLGVGYTFQDLVILSVDKNLSLVDSIQVLSKRLDKAHFMNDEKYQKRKRIVAKYIEKVRETLTEQKKEVNEEVLSCMESIILRAYKAPRFVEVCRRSGLVPSTPMRAMLVGNVQSYSVQALLNALGPGHGVKYSLYSRCKEAYQFLQNDYEEYAKHFLANGMTAYGMELVREPTIAQCQDAARKGEWLNPFEIAKMHVALEKVKKQEVPVLYRRAQSTESSYLDRVLDRIPEAAVRRIPALRELVTIVLTKPEGKEDDWYAIRAQSGLLTTDEMKNLSSWVHNPAENEAFSLETVCARIEKQYEQAQQEGISDALLQQLFSLGLTVEALREIVYMREQSRGRAIDELNEKARNQKSVVKLRVGLMKDYRKIYLSPQDENDARKLFVMKLLMQRLPEEVHDLDGELVECVGKALTLPLVGGGHTTNESLNRKYAIFYEAQLLTESEIRLLVEGRYIDNLDARINTFPIARVYERFKREQQLMQQLSTDAGRTFSDSQVHGFLMYGFTVALLTKIAEARNHGMNYYGTYFKDGRLEESTLRHFYQKYIGPFEEFVRNDGTYNTSRNREAMEQVLATYQGVMNNIWGRVSGDSSYRTLGHAAGALSTLIKDKKMRFFATRTIEKNTHYALLYLPFMRTLGIDPLERYSARAIRTITNGVVFAHPSEIEAIRKENSAIRIIAFDPEDFGVRIDFYPMVVREMIKPHRRNGHSPQPLIIDGAWSRRLMNESEKQCIQEAFVRTAA